GLPVEREPYGTHPHPSPDNQTAPTSGLKFCGRYPPGEATPVPLVSPRDGGFPLRLRRGIPAAALPPAAPSIPMHVRFSVRSPPTAPGAYDGRPSPADSGGGRNGSPR